MWKLQIWGGGKGKKLGKVNDFQDMVVIGCLSYGEGIFY